MSAVLESAPAEITRPPFVPGVHTDISHADYLQIDALSASACKLILQSPAHYRWHKEHPSPPTAAMDIGTAVHMGVLEPDRFESDVIEMPEFNRRTNAGKSDLADFLYLNAGRVCLDAADMAKVRAMIGNVRRHPGAQSLLSAGRPEVTLMWTDARLGLPCKARFDFLRDDLGSVDLKSTRDASPEGWGRQVASLGYLVQAAFYWNGIEHLLDNSPPFWSWVCVENEPPYCAATYVAQADAMRFGMYLVESAMVRYADCLARGYWPGYSEKIQPAEVPRWYLKHSAN